MKQARASEAGTTPATPGESGDGAPWWRAFVPHDRSLAVQLVRAASSCALNLGEGEYSDPGTRRARYCNAAGSANETRAALSVAVAWGYLTPAQAEPASSRLDRVIAMLWKLTHG